MEEGMVSKERDDTEKLWQVNKRILKAGLILIGVSLVLSFLFIYFSRLKEPVFLYHYYETELPMKDGQNSGTFILFYLANRSDTRKVTGINFKEAPEIQFLAGESNSGRMFMGNYGVNQQGEYYGGYSLHSVYVTFPYGSNLQDMDGRELSQATFDFTDGSQLNANIGRVCLYIPDYSDKGLNAYSASSSSGGTASTKFNVRTALALVKLDSPLMDSINKLYNIEVDGSGVDELMGREYDRDSELTVSSKFNNPSDIVERLSFYDLKPELYFKTADGRIYSERLYNFDYNLMNRQFTHLEILEYLRARGEL